MIPNFLNKDEAILFSDSNVILKKSQDDDDFNIWNNFKFNVSASSRYLL